MKIPERAPEWRPILQESFDVIFKLQNYNEINDFIVKVDQRDKYLYWDKFKHLKLPKNVSAEHLWAYLKFSRQPKIMKASLISDKDEKFGYCIPSSVLENLSFIDKHTSGEIIVGDSSIHKSEQKRYLVNSLMEEAIASSQLEGAATTRKVAKEMLRSGRRPKNNAEQMIFNNYKTIAGMKDLIDKPLDDNILFKLHKSMTIDTMDSSECGRFRTMEDDKIYVVDSEGNILHDPPKADKISSLMKTLYDYANDVNDSHFVHPIIKAINLHFYLSYIHPFMDGNGRTARALFYWYAIKHDYWMFEYLTISRVFLDAPSKYARAFLYTEMDSLDLTYFISFHLRVIKNSIVKLVEYIKRKQKKASETSYYLKKYKELNERQRSLIKHAVEHPDEQYAIAMHQNIHNITYEAARKDLKFLEMKKLLVRIKKERRYYYMPSDNLLKRIKDKMMPK
ncbi:MAG: Fic family protein [Candidatus Omnitrophica bacterium]|nr:Fic family protein [Candidatus Omnitrophota bacterium]